MNISFLFHLILQNSFMKYTLLKMLYYLIAYAYLIECTNFGIM